MSMTKIFASGQKSVEIDLPMGGMEYMKTALEVGDEDPYL